MHYGSKIVHIHHIYGTHSHQNFSHLQKSKYIQSTITHVVHPPHTSRMFLVLPLRILQTLK